MAYGDTSDVEIRIFRCVEFQFNTKVFIISFLNTFTALKGCQFHFYS